MTSIPLPALHEDGTGPEGGVPILDRDGWPTPDRGSFIRPCRCGHVADEPSRDGSHSRAAWKEDA
jgi:hypothetical protein